MNIKNFFKNFLFGTCGYYTALTMGFLLLCEYLKVTERPVNAVLFFSMLVFSAIMGLGYALIRIEALDRFSARCLHAIAYVAAYFTFAIMLKMKFELIAITTVFFVILYALITVIIFVADRIIKKRMGKVTSAKRPAASAKKSEYKSQFGK